jgi:hypothetical protein
MNRFVMVAIMLGCLCGCTPSAVPDCSSLQNQSGTLHVLFIGNSYTYVNDLPGMFSQLACAGGHPVQTGMAAQGGWRLEDLLSISGRKTAVIPNHRGLIWLPASFMPRFSMRHLKV